MDDPGVEEPARSRLWRREADAALAAPNPKRCPGGDLSAGSNLGGLHDAHFRMQTWQQNWSAPVGGRAGIGSGALARTVTPIGSRRHDDG